MRTNGPAVRARARSGALALAAAIAMTTVPAAVPASAQDASPLEPDDVLVTVDQAYVISLPKPANAVVIGNPAIADATIMDAMTLVITGRSYGTTNLIVLDGTGALIVEQLITVQSADNLVTVFRRDTRQTFSCTPICAPMLNVGDADPAFESTSDQIQTRSALALGN